MKENEKKKNEEKEKQTSTSPATDSVISLRTVCCLLSCEPIYSCLLATKVSQCAGGKKLQIRLMRREEIRYSRWEKGKNGNTEVKIKKKNG